MKLFRVDKDAKFIQYAERDFKKENQEEVLEFWLEHNPAHILEDENVLIIGRQVPTNLGSIIDLLGIFFEDLLDFAETNGLPIHWGTRGFSINVDLNGKHVAILYGFPPNSVFKQGIYTAFREIRNNVKDSEPVIEEYRQELAQLGTFENAQSEQKWLIKNDVDADKKERFFAILSSIVEKIKSQLDEVEK